LRPRLAILADAANDVRDSVRRARARNRAHPRPNPERESAEEIKRRLDQTRARLRRQVAPRADED
jgi:hypothetical protein